MDHFCGYLLFSNFPNSFFLNSKHCLNALLKYQFSNGNTLERTFLPVAARENGAKRLDEWK